MFSSYFLWSVKIISLILSRANQVGRTKVKDFERKPLGHPQAECVFLLDLSFKLGPTHRDRLSASNNSPKAACCCKPQMMKMKCKVLLCEVYYTDHKRSVHTPTFTAAATQLEGSGEQEEAPSFVNSYIIK